MAAPTLDEVRTWIGGNAPEPTPSSELRLAESYAAAVEGVEGACFEHWIDGTDPYPAGVRLGIFLVAHRLVTRPESPNGIGGFDGLGNVFRILSSDPDVKSALAPYVDPSRLFA